MEFAALLDEVMANHEFDMYLMGSSLDTDPDPKPIWHSDSSSDEKGNSAWNIVAYRNPEADRVMDEALGHHRCGGAQGALQGVLHHGQRGLPRGAPVRPRCDQGLQRQHRELRALYL